MYVLCMYLCMCVCSYCNSSQLVNCYFRFRAKNILEKTDPASSEYYYVMLAQTARNSDMVFGKCDVKQAGRRRRNARRCDQDRDSDTHRHRTVSGNEGDIYIHPSGIHTSIYSSLRADVWQAMRGWSQSATDSPLFIPYWQLPYAIVLRRVILQQLGASSIAQTRFALSDCCIIYGIFHRFQSSV